MHRTTVKTFRLAALLCLLPTLAFAAAPQGAWRGSIQRGTDSVPVEASFSTNAVEVRFPSTFACKVKADYVRPEGKSLTYRFGLSINGGAFCDGLMGKALTVTADGSNTVTLAFSSSGDWTGELTRQSPTP
ncbi:hypothetical protein [Luteibacter sp. UNCMF366Tsu5.1]|uniref:hypothetical protein n=1 Tax=Luteibacter sp. UNCMF366Tsu5.1 TaxID=1502758 RepID=UPI0009084C6B|nr:hypothetical protein [Luteibacter sp. UNCMF366Tsu5.1]SFW28394.1 hypothetical protein SAMN02800691_0764 [Luteibacter sp. UNCMF366Tsu5.1]